jgi:pimeloyl-ACP methyl ester carboxylesterase
MRIPDCIRALVLALVAALPAAAQVAPAPAGTDNYVIFLRSRLIGREEVTVQRAGEGWLIKGTSRMAAPIDSVARVAEIRYDGDWHAQSARIEGMVRGQEVNVQTTFAGGKAVSRVYEAGKETEKTDEVAPDSPVLPNLFFGAYAALARRLPSVAPGTTITGYILPQAEVPIRVTETIAERFDTPQRQVHVTRYVLGMPSAGEVITVNVWVEEGGRLVRISVPSQGLDVAREDIASAASRLTTFVIDGEEPVRIAATGFNLAGMVAKPAAATGPLPAVILVGGSAMLDRDGIVGGVPVLGQIARDLREAGFLVVRYDRRGLGQSGGRAETAALTDYAEDVRAVVEYLKERKDVDGKRIAVAGHGDGAWIALQAAARQKDIRAVALLGAASVTGAGLVLEQQQRQLALLKVGEDERNEKIALQKRINAAAAAGGPWDGIPDPLRRQADSAWFQSFLAFEPARVMKDVRQPVLVVHGALDRQVDVRHAEALAAMARARKKDPGTDVATVPGANHLLVPARTGEVDEYPVLEPKEVASAATGALGTWLARVMGEAKK